MDTGDDFTFCQVSSHVDGDGSETNKLVSNIADISIKEESSNTSSSSSSSSNTSYGPPCTGFVEGMAPVFSRSAWYCTWHLIQNDLVHGWGVDIKLGYCAQGDRTQNVGIVDSEYVVHNAIQTLGGSSHDHKAKKHRASALDARTEIRRQSSWELQIFKERWNKAVAEDRNWVDPFKRDQRRLLQRRNRQRFS
uniref:Uncharacterized protein n=1 Tax=Lotus japonicus TaxID=34305 RepID=I3T162_LOTJA|nr:unknown [Lotus japonicus]